MRKAFVAATTVALLALLVSPATGAPGGNGKGGGGGSSGGGSQTTTFPTIDLCLVDGVAVNGCASEQVSAEVAPTPHLGGTVSFAVTYPRLPGNATARIQVLCYQSGEIVYGEAYNFDQTFLLGGGWSQWLATGGAASCQADLYYWEYHGEQTFNLLKSTTFYADGTS